MKRIAMILAGLVALAFSAAPSMAGTITGSMPVTANILPWCGLYLTTLDLGDYAGTVVSVSNDLTVICTPDLPYNVSMDAGTHYDGSWRRVSDGTNFARYAINKTGDGEWGDADFADTYGWGSSLAGTGTGGSVNHNMTAYVLGGQAPPVGTYTDTVVVNVYF
ncbi:MAG TPA: spore coat U domain-containing protein [bacterium]|nr:spore coat U domain-containing protein [bacterium]